ncbi:LysE family transporter [Aquimarina algicola]|uniref:Lysine transporter LysE n=1 Tax=Aquimarina algicola TaxID=2589995 RepID=A0A504J656_9FLAO|nr:LysE family transporter [Aquimarina algicola]TPN85994.1 hypothetical protein FHK87_12010 [Aquimarina algicola]
MILFYLLLGVITAIVGALPLGAVNIAVINSSIKENIKGAAQIALAAGIGEILLALFALHCSIELVDFFEQHIWIQTVFIICFFVAGLYYFFIKSKSAAKNKTIVAKKTSRSKYILGFSLAVLNPPVIIYWILAISMVNKYIFKLTIQNSLISLSLFFLGIYIGKISTLYVYGRWGNKIAKKSSNSTNKLSRLIGVVLVIISIFQSVNVFLS